MSVIGTDHTTARQVALGMICLECSEPFVKAHGFPVACEFCWKKLDPETRKAVARATNPEATATHFRNEAKKKKARSA